MGNADLPLAPGKEHVKAFQRAGWTLLDRRGRGKHFILKMPGHPHTISIPDHREPVKRALLAAQVKRAGMTIAEYVDHFANR